jgi:hypothetical protein
VTSLIAFSKASTPPLRTNEEKVATDGEGYSSYP